jgi:4-alpha-glucanotransferase
VGADIVIGKRRSGILLHITSLPSGDAIGNLGPGARAFIDFLADAGQSYWQILPLNPPSPGEGNSPYSSSSAFAGNTLLISPEQLLLHELVRQADIPSIPADTPDKVDYALAIEHKDRIMQCAYDNFKSRHDRGAFERFCSETSYWLDDYALFKALKGQFGGISWADWPPDIRDREPLAIANYSTVLRSEIEKERVSQFLFHRQWMEIKEYANDRGIEIIGDIPIYMSCQSSDVWAHPEIFKLDENKKPLFVSGVPPDYFSENGQLWGNPVYNWERLTESGFDWWVQRIDHNLKLLDILRIDHFRGLVAYWQVPAYEKTAIHGTWVTVPCDKFFSRLRDLFPTLPFIAEDLGTITPDVRAFIEKLNLPGMKILLFAFGEGLPESPYAMHNHVKNCVVYTGTHDNNTARGWFEKEATKAEKESLARYIGREVTAGNIHDILVRMSLMSVADMVLLPMQDILGLGAEARMNTPSTTSGNWEWRMKSNCLTPELSGYLKNMTHVYGRLSKKIGG